MTQPVSWWMYETQESEPTRDRLDLYRATLCASRANVTSCREMSAVSQENSFLYQKYRGCFAAREAMQGKVLTF